MILGKKISERNEWKKRAEEDLKNFRSYQRAIKNTEDRIQMLNDRMTAARAAVITDAPHDRNGSRQYEDILLDAITERDNLKLWLSAQRRRVGLIEQGLSALGDNERYLLEVFFVDRPHEGGHAEIICEKLGVEVATAYRMKDAALRRFVMEEYGVSV